MSYRGMSNVPLCHERENRQLQQAVNRQSDAINSTTIFQPLSDAAHDGCSSTLQKVGVSKENADFVASIYTPVAFAIVARGAGSSSTKFSMPTSVTSSQIYTELELLNLQLASEAQMAEIGNVIASGTEIDDVKRLISQYGGVASDWEKVTSNNYSLKGYTVETHWYRNVSTGVSYEMKTKFVKFHYIPLNK